MTPIHITDDGTRLVLELEQPITPGDLERAYCTLLEEVAR